MNFWQLSDGIRPQHQPHHHGHHGDHADAPGWPASFSDSIDTGDNSAGDGGNGFFAGLVVNTPSTMFSPVDIAHAGGLGQADAHQSNLVQIDQHAVQMAGIGGNGGNDNLAQGGIVSALAPSAASVHAGPASSGIETGHNSAGNGGDGYFYGSMIHASMVFYEPINISVSAGYGSIALADQTNNVSIDQSAAQIAGIGGNGGDGNIASGGNAGVSSSGSDAIATGHNSAGNGGSGSFSGSLVDAPVVIYHPINIALAGSGGTAEASQSNTVEIDQSVLQMAGIGGNGGSGNIAIGGDVSGSLLGGWQLLQTGGNEAGNGGNGFFHGSLVHTSVAVYDPINIAVAGYNSSTDAHQTNNVNLDQSSSQMAGIGGNGGNGNAATGGNGGLLSKFSSGADTIATGGNGAGDGGSGHFSGSLVDVSIAIYAPINIAIAGPHATAEADQINNVHFDQSAVQIAGIGGDGGNGNIAVGGELATHLLSDLHLVA
ncbi:hypothetical protein [Bradyrhizobium sp. STM 3562]|uniref:hypothetical protein n=1 Tax=Bradyrhizobium sp. STM 3562 TaxID=578924 RepID=UPI00388E3957